MSELRSKLCTGTVMHRRYSPRRHELNYKVHSLLVDLDELDSVDRQLKLLSVNRFNLFSVFESDHGPGDGGDLKAWLLNRIAEAGHRHEISRVLMLCFPRVLGYVFNPLTVYYCLAPTGDIAVLVYEVNNTFGGRHFYIVPVNRHQTGVIGQTAAKQFYVSPFNDVSGQYGFRVSRPGKDLTVGVSLKVAGKPVLNAVQTATTQLLTDCALWRAFCAMPLMTVKVIVGIHFEAALLWFKGLRIQRRPNPTASVSTPVSSGAPAYND